MSRKTLKNKPLVEAILEVSCRRRISMSEARRIALEIMQQSDRLRDEFAEKEARASALWHINS
jgi:hypothetical protein